MNKTHTRSFFSVIIRGILGRCPNCGGGKIFFKYLKQASSCIECNEKLGEIRADDGPAWLTILIVGHLLAPFIIIFAFSTDWPDWLSIIIWSALSIILALIILPRAKGVFISIIWWLKNKS